MTNVQLYQQIYIKMLPIASDSFDLVKYTELVDKTYDECAKRCKIIKQKSIDSQTTDEDIENDFSTFTSKDGFKMKFAPSPFDNDYLPDVDTLFMELKYKLTWPLSTQEIKDSLYKFFNLNPSYKQFEILKIAKNKGLIKLHHKEGKKHYWNIGI